MHNGKKVIVTRQIESRLELYDGFFDHAWARKLAETAPAAIRDAVGRLCLAWKEASNTHRLPWLMVHQMKKFAEGFLRAKPSKGRRLVDTLQAKLFSKLGDDLKRAHRREIINTLNEFDQAIRIADDDAHSTFPVMHYWDEIIGHSEFHLSITGSQSLAYCALVFGYECFLVACFGSLGGDTEERPGGKKFWPEFKKLLGGDPKATYWDDRPVFIGREARNCIAHRGGKAKPELLATKPALFISPEGVLSIQPADNRDLHGVLKAKVDRLVGEVRAKLSGA